MAALGAYSNSVNCCREVYRCSSRETYLFLFLFRVGITSASAFQSAKGASKTLAISVYGEDVTSPLRYVLLLIPALLTVTGGGVLASI